MQDRFVETLTLAHSLEFHILNLFIHITPLSSYKTGGGLPLGVEEKVLAMLKGRGRHKFWGSFYVVA